MMKYVIVGAGPCGVTAAETLRAIDPTGRIILIDGEGSFPYGRMSLPYLLNKKIEKSGLYLRKGNSYFLNQKIEVVKGIVEALLVSSNTIRLNTGECVCFDKLLIATGSKPVNPMIEGLQLPGVYNCWNIDDAQKIANRLEKNSKVVVLGGGFIGCIIMEAVNFVTANLTVLEASEYMAGSMLDPVASKLLEDWCLKKGINVLTSSQAISMESNGGDLTIFLNDGGKLNADLVIVATGVVPSINFLRGSGIKVDIGVLIDHNFQTNINTIFAAGDVAQGRDFSTQLMAVHAIQTTAVEHGRIAALNMGGRIVDYRGSLNMRVLDILGLVLCSFGHWKEIDGGESSFKLDKTKFRYTLLNFFENRLIGALTVGWTGSLGIIRGFIQTPMKLGKWKQKLIKDPNLIFKAYIDKSRF